MTSFFVSEESKVLEMSEELNTLVKEVEKNRKTVSVRGTTFMP